MVYFVYSMWVSLLLCHDQHVFLKINGSYMSSVVYNSLNSISTVPWRDINVLNTTLQFWDKTMVIKKSTRTKTLVISESWLRNLWSKTLYAPMQPCHPPQNGHMQSLLQRTAQDQPCTTVSQLPPIILSYNLKFWGWTYPLLPHLSKVVSNRSCLRTVLRQY